MIRALFGAIKRIAQIKIVKRLFKIVFTLVMILAVGYVIYTLKKVF